MPCLLQQEHSAHPEPWEDRGKPETCVNKGMKALSPSTVMPTSTLTTWWCLHRSYCCCSVAFHPACSLCRRLELQGAKSDHKCSSVTRWLPHKPRASRHEVPSAPGAEPTPSAGRALLTMAQRGVRCQHRSLEHDLAYTPSVLASAAEPSRQAGRAGKEQSGPLKRNAGCCPQGIQHKQCAPSQVYRWLVHTRIASLPCQSSSR